MWNENVTGERDEHVVDENVAGVGDDPLVDKNVAGVGDEPLVDERDKVVLDAGNGGNDDRFTNFFEKGSKEKPKKEEYQNFEEQETTER